MSDDVMHRLREQLEAERDELRGRLDELDVVEPGKTVHNQSRNEAGWSQAAKTTEQRSQRLGEIDHTRSRLEQVEAALERMAEGSYGRCEVCEEAIGEDRLASLPLVTRCLDCASDAAA